MGDDFPDFWHPAEYGLFGQTDPLPNGPELAPFRLHPLDTQPAKYVTFKGDGPLKMRSRQQLYTRTGANGDASTRDAVTAKTQAAARPCAAVAVAARLDLPAGP